MEDSLWRTNAEACEWGEEGSDGVEANVEAFVALMEHAVPLSTGPKGDQVADARHRLSPESDTPPPESGLVQSSSGSFCRHRGRARQYTDQ